MEQAGKSRGDRDRISSLPDCLIHLIMAFLTAQEAVQTCILSKRWKNLWTTLPFLHFKVEWSKFEYDRERDDGESEDGYRFDRELQECNFVEKYREFVGMTLLLREPTDLHKFHLCCYEFSWPPEYHMFIRSWILYALKHKLQVLNIDFSRERNIAYSDPEISLPLGVFICKSLVDISLHSFNSVRNIDDINLPYLRRLSLWGIYLNQDFVDKLFSGCPVLEFLHLGSCLMDFCIISSQSLKHLEVNCNCSYRETEKRIEFINTPKLLSFGANICLDLIGTNFLLKMPTLTNASIYIKWCKFNGSSKAKSNILSGLLNVRNLKLSGYCIKDLLENELLNYPEFPNVRDLSVNDLCLNCHFNLFACFINQCPNLEKISLSYLGCYCEEEVQKNRESLKLAPFKGNRLEIVEFNFNKQDKNSHQVMMYLQDFTEKSRAQINMTCLYDWAPLQRSSSEASLWKQLFIEDSD